jgi:hypothetical protein
MGEASSRRTPRGLSGATKRRERLCGEAAPSACACEHHRLPHRSRTGRIPARDIGDVDAADEPRSAAIPPPSGRASERDPNLRCSWTSRAGRILAEISSDYALPTSRDGNPLAGVRGGRPVRTLTPCLRRSDDRVRSSTRGRTGKSLCLRAGSRWARLTAPSGARPRLGFGGAAPLPLAAPLLARIGRSGDPRPATDEHALEQPSLGRVAPALGEAKARANVDFVGVVARPASLAVRGGRHFGVV